MEAILDPESLDEEQKAEAEAKENEAEKKGGIPTLDDLLRDTEDEENSKLDDSTEAAEAVEGNKQPILDIDTLGLDDDEEVVQVEEKTVEL